ncbi:hypothetical protein NPIL_334611, partial [Nephila pilipes]
MMHPLFVKNYGLPRSSLYENYYCTGAVQWVVDRIFRNYSEKGNIDLSKETNKIAEKSPTIPFNVYIGKGVCLEDFNKTLYLG